MSVDNEQVHPEERALSQALDVLNRMHGMPRGQASRFLATVDDAIVAQFAKCESGDDIASVFRGQAESTPQKIK